MIRKQAIIAAMWFLSICYAEPEEYFVGLTETCECGSFWTDVPEKEESPIVSRIAMNTTCDERGELECQIVCSSLMSLNMNFIGNIICDKVEFALDEKPALFIRICEFEWIYVGIDFPFPLCCSDRKVVECPPPMDLIIDSF